MLTRFDIEMLSERPGVRKVAVEKFLYSMPCEFIEAIRKLGHEAKIYHWNEATEKAILHGILKAFGKEAILCKEKNNDRKKASWTSCRN